MACFSFLTRITKNERTSVWMCLIYFCFVMDLMELRLYNTMTRSKELFRPLMDEWKADFVLMYSCGPTVYGEQHIGNMRAAYFADVTKKVIKSVCGYPLKHTTNITDVGHLTDDGDQWEDKMEKWSRKEWLTAWEVARKYEKWYLEDVASLGIELSDHYPRATEHIVEQISIVKQMYERGLTYVIPWDWIYCDTSKVKAYGKMLPEGHLDGLQEWARIDASGKKNMTDFALWKFSPLWEQRQMEWVFDGERSAALIVNDEWDVDYPWSVVMRESLTATEKKTLGFPGWHVECSAMSWASLWEELDIHTGGIDHIPVHHTNEIAQSECSFCSGGKQWVKYRMHNQFLNIDAAKISKSLWNVVCMSDVRAKWIEPLAVRFFFHQAHYRSFQDFTRDALHAAEKSRKNLMKKLQKISLSDDMRGRIEWTKSIYDLIDEDATRDFVFDLISSLFDDLQMPQVMAKVQSAVKELTIWQCHVIYWLDQKVLWLDLWRVEDDSDAIDIPSWIMLLAEQRWDAKQSKNRSEADRLRAEIDAAWYTILDEKDWRKVVKK